MLKNKVINFDKVRVPKYIFTCVRIDNGADVYLTAKFEKGSLVVMGAFSGATSTSAEERKGFIKSFKLNSDELNQWYKIFNYMALSSSVLSWEEIVDCSLLFDLIKEMEGGVL